MRKNSWKSIKDSFSRNAKYVGVLGRPNASYDRINSNGIKQNLNRFPSWITFSSTSHSERIHRKEWKITSDGGKNPVKSASICLLRSQLPSSGFHRMTATLIFCPVEHAGKLTILFFIPSYLFKHLSPQKQPREVQAHNFSRPLLARCLLRLSFVLESIWKDSFDGLKCSISIATGEHQQ